MTNDIETLREVAEKGYIVDHTRYCAALDHAIALYTAIEAAAGEEGKLAQEKIDKAYAMVSDLCNRRREWIMSIPARRDYDPDLVITEGLMAGESAITALAASEARVKTLTEALKKTVSALRYPDNGVHYCRGCDAGTHNKWQHYEHCNINTQSMLIDEVKAEARAALKEAGHE